MQRSILRILHDKRLSGTAIKHSVSGVPQNVLVSKAYDSIGYKNDHEVSIIFLAAPINPSDLNMVEGVYCIEPKLSDRKSVV